MSDITDLFDTYGLRARLLPALVVVLPVAVVVALVFPAVYATASSIGGSLGVASAFLFLLSHVLRARGRALEVKLYAAWGGIPTTCWLRHRDNRLDEHTKARYHSFLRERIPSLTVPSAMEEASDPERADAAYASAVKWLLEFTRNADEFPLVFKENVTYGFRRNLLAAKPLALKVLSVLIVVVGLVAWKRYHADWMATDAEFLLAFVVLAGTIALWTTLIRTEWVRDAAEGYARALLATCDSSKKS
ncbi:MAG: hypothetical protein AB7P08_06180 [Burkholderiales bacterium]